MSRRGNYWALKLGATPIIATPPQARTPYEPLLKPVFVPPAKAKPEPPVEVKSEPPVEVKPEPPVEVKSEPPAKAKKLRDGYSGRAADGGLKPHITGHHREEGKPRGNRKKPRGRSPFLPDTESKVAEVPEGPIPQVLSIGQTSYAVHEHDGLESSDYDLRCDAVRTERMALLVASGINMLIAAASMGLKIDKVRNWNARGRRDIAEGKDTPFARWWSAMLVAKASCEANWVSRLNEGAVTDWRAAAFMLERRFHVRWANRPALNKTVEASEVAGKSAQELLIMLQAMKEGRSLSADTSGVPKPYEPPRDRLGRNMEFAGIKDEDE